LAFRTDERIGFPHFFDELAPFWRRVHRRRGRYRYRKPTGNRPRFRYRPRPR
jgi:hypothetical protein